MRFVVHIGLPKTGTSFLQYCCFPYLQSSDLFLGKYEDRSADHDLFTGLNRTIMEGARRLGPAEAAALQALESSDYERVFYSNEMVLVDSPTRSWQSQLATLGHILNGRSCDVLVTVRDPLPALYSLFVELWPGLPRTYRSPTAFVQNHNSASAFRFRSLLGSVEEVFPESTVRLFNFPDVIAMSPGTAIYEYISPRYVERRTVNQKTLSGNGQYHANPSDLASLAARSTLGRVVGSCIPAPIRQGVGRAARSLTLRRSGELIPTFEPALVEWIERVYADDCSFLESKYGIRLAERR